MTSSETVLIEIDRLINHLKISPKDINTIIYNNGLEVLLERGFSAIVQAIDSAISVLFMELIL